MAEPPSQPRAAHAKKSRILVIDDQTELLSTIGTMLNHLGHECVSCPDPIKALDVIDDEKQNLDMIITDYSMPGLSGLEIIDYCTEHLPNLPVVLITGYPRKLTMINKLGRPANNILLKPFSLETLRGMLDKLL